MNKKIQAKQIDLENLESNLHLDTKYADKTKVQSDIDTINSELAGKATTEYVDSKVSTEIGKIVGEGTLDEAMDTISEIQTFIKENQDAIDALEKLEDNNTTYTLLGTPNATTNGMVSISLESSDPAEEVDKIKITGSGNVSVTSDFGGNIFIHGEEPPSLNIANGEGEDTLVQLTSDHEQGNEQCTATGAASSAFGKYNVVTGKAAMAVNYDNKVNAKYGFAANANNTVDGDANAAFGGLNAVTGSYSIVAGHSNTSKGDAGFTTGRNNTMGLNAIANIMSGVSNAVYGDHNIVIGTLNTAGVESEVDVYNNVIAGNNNAATYATSSLIIGAGNTGIDISSAIIAGSGNMANYTVTNSVIAGASNTSDTSTANNVLVGANNTTNTGSINSVIVGSGNNVKIQATLMGGINNIITDARSSIIAGSGNTVNNTSQYGIIVGENNTVNKGNNNIVLGSKGTVKEDSHGNVMSGYNSTVGGSWNVLLGGNTNDIFTAYASIVGGQNNKIQTGGINSAIIGGINNIIKHSNASIQNNSLVTGDSNTVEHIDCFVTGKGNKTGDDYQTIVGKYNVPDSADLFVVGTGSSDTNRVNAHTVDIFGEGWFKGAVFVGGTNKYDPNAKRLATISEIPSIDHLASKDYVNTRFEELVGAAPEALDTLGELADALGEDANFSATVLEQLGNKADLDKITGDGNVTVTKDDSGNILIHGEEPPSVSIINGEGEDSILQKDSDSSSKTITYESSSSELTVLSDNADLSTENIVLTFSEASQTAELSLNFPAAGDHMIYIDVLADSTADATLYVNDVLMEDRTIEASTITADQRFSFGVDPLLEGTNVLKFECYNFEDETKYLKIALITVRGKQNAVPGLYSAAFGRYNTVKSHHSMAVNYNNVVNGSYSFAGNGGNLVEGNSSTAFGSSNTIVTGTETNFATGLKNTIKGSQNFITGRENTAELNSLANIIGGAGNKVYAENTIVTGNSNISGSSTTESKSAVILGTSNTVNAENTIVGGATNTVGGNTLSKAAINSVVAGVNNNTAILANSVIVGTGNTVDTKLEHSIVSGSTNTVKGSGSIVTGYAGTATGSWNVLLGGNGNTVNTNYATVINGTKNSVSGVYSAIVGGNNNTISSQNSFTTGVGNSVIGDAQTVIGKYNKASEDYIFAVGNGTSNTNRKNSHTLDRSGDAWFQGNVYIGGTSKDDTIAERLAKVSEIPSIDHLASEEYVNTRFEELVGAAPEALDTLGELSKALGEDANFSATVLEQLGNKIEASNITGSGSVTITKDTNGNVTIKGTDTTYDAFDGSNIGLVPAGSNGDDDVYLTGAGTWKSVAGSNLKVTLTKNWTGTTAPYTQTINVSGVEATDVPNIGPILTGVLATDMEINNAWEKIYRITTGHNKIIVYSYEPLDIVFGLNIHIASKLQINTGSISSTGILYGNKWMYAQSYSTPSNEYCAYYQEMTVPGVTATNNAVISIAGTATEAQRIEAMKAEFFVYSQGVDTITVCISSSAIKPTGDIPITVVIVE